jgi:UDP-sugar transporter A1/2/3
MKRAFRASVATAAPPAFVYAIQNVAIAYAQRNLDGITYNILNQSKLLSSALMGYYILRRKQTMPQIFSLFLLFVASVLAVASKSTPESTMMNQGLHTTGGVIAAIIASSLSGLSGTLSDLAMQKKSRDAFQFSAELSVFVLITMVIGMWINHLTAPTGTSELSRIYAAGGLLESAGVYNITSPALIPIISAAWGGILVGQVTKLVGSVRKGFAVCAGIVLTAIIDSTNSGDNFTIYVSIVLAIAAVVMHSLSSQEGASINIKSPKKK